MSVATQIHLNKYIPRSYQLPILDALENKGYRRVLAVLPRRAGKDVTAFNYCIRYLLKNICVIYYIFPTYSQGRKILWESITNSGQRILEYIPAEVIESSSSQEMKVRFKNGSLFQVVGSDNFDCFDDKTEILTDNGWKLFKDINQTEDAVATLCDGSLKYELPKQHVVYDYDGVMFSIKNSAMDMLVTPNHRFFVRSSKGVYKFKEISDPTIKGDSIPSTCDWIKGRNYSDDENFWCAGNLWKAQDFVALVGIFLSEGSTYRDYKTYRITISQTKPEVRLLIEDLLHRLNINFCKTKDRFDINSRNLYLYFSQFGTQEYRFIPKDIKSMGKDNLRTLWTWLLLGDGYQGEGYTAYYSVSKRLMDDVQEIVIKLGLSGNVHVKKQVPSFIRGRLVVPKKILYELRVRKSKFKRLCSSKKNYISQEHYRGKVYCVSTESGVIKVRRNGKECWSGNSLVGTNPKGIVFSEYALQDPRAYQYLRPILAANDGWALFLSTPRGKNHLYELYQMAIYNPEWFVYKLSLDDTKHIPQIEIERERAEGIMSEDLIQQEYYTSFEMGVEGSYYAKYVDRMRIKGQISMVPWEPSALVHTAWDLGVRDSTCIIFFQTIGQIVRIIDCYDKNKEGLEHYVGVIKSKPYTYGKHIAPHDIKVKEFGSGMTRLEKAKDLKINFIVAPDLSVMDGIEAVRSALSKIWIDEKCVPLIKSLEGYRQEFDAKRRVYKPNPLHDQNSHYADAMRYLCICLPKTRDSLTAEEHEKRLQNIMMGPNANLPSVFRSDLPPY